MPDIDFSGSYISVPASKTARVYFNERDHVTHLPTLFKTFS